MIADKDLLL